MQTTQPFAATGGVTAGTLARGPISQLSTSLQKFSWTNADVVALGGVTTGSITVCTLPAKTIVTKATIILTGAATNVTALTVSLGRTSAAFIDYVVASNAKSVANTVYGQAFANLGANLSALVGDLPSVTATTDVKLQFVSSIENLSTVLTSAGDIFLETTQLP